VIFRRRSPAHRDRPLRLTRLEDRTAPAVATWHGGGADNNWTTAANWAGDVAPQAGDDLVFPAGPADLVAVNDFAAGTTFNSLNVTGGGYQLGGSAVTLSGGVSADVPAGGSATLALAVGGAGGVVKAGGGTLVLSGENTYAGLTDIRAGVLEAHADTALGATGAGNETVVQPGAVAADPGGTLRLVGPITVPEAITFSGPGSLAPGPFAVAALQAIGGPTLSGPLTAAGYGGIAAAEGTLTVTGALGESGGPWGLTLSGPVHFAATATTALAGNLTVVGTTRFDGRVLAGDTSVLFNGVLRGTGTTGRLSVIGFGVVSPGADGPGVLTTGDLLIPQGDRNYPPGALEVDLANVAVHGGVGVSGDRVDVRGAVLLGGQLRLLPAPGLVVPRGVRVTIISNDGTDAVTGTFAGLPEGAVVSTVGGVPLRVTYRGGDGNDVELYTVAAADRRRFAAGAGPGGGPHVKVYDATGAVRLSFYAYDPAFRGGVRVATGDVTGDGVPDVVTAPGPGGGPHVKVFDGATGALVRQWMAYDPGFAGGVFVAVADVVPDGRAEVITGAGPGGGPHVKVYEGGTTGGAAPRLLRQFMAYDVGFRGGVSVAGFAGEQFVHGPPLLGVIVTGAGPGGGPHVKAFRLGDGGSPLASFFAYDPAFRGGVTVAAASDGFGTLGRSIVTGPGPGGGPDVRVYRVNYNPANYYSTVPAVLAASFAAYAPAFGGGVTVGVQPVGAGGAGAILTGAGPGGGPHVKVWDYPGLRERLGLFAFDPGFTGGVFVG
jgi:autotransporter-associated beta strand protein